MADVSAHRRLGDDRGGSDLAIVEAASHQDEHLALPIGESPDEGPVDARARSNLGLDKPTGAGWSQKRIPGGDQPDGRHQVFGRRVLEDEAARSGAEGLVDVLVCVKCGHDEDPECRVLIDHLPGRREAVESRHPDVHEHHLRAVTPSRDQSVLSIDSLADHFNVGLALEDQSKSGSDHRLIVCDQHPDHAVSYGRRARTRKPPPWRATASKRPPKRLTLSRIPIRPWPPTISPLPVGPLPSSSIATSTAPPSHLTLTLTRLAPACLRTFVRASWAIRYAERSTPGGINSRPSSTFKSTTKPALRICWTSRPRCRRLGCGSSSSSSPGCRSIATSRRSSDMAERPVDSTESKDSRAFTG